MAHSWTFPAPLSDKPPRIDLCLASFTHLFQNVLEKRKTRCTGRATPARLKRDGVHFFIVATHLTVHVERIEKPPRERGRAGQPVLGIERGNEHHRFLCSSLASTNPLPALARISHCRRSKASPLLLPPLTATDVIFRENLATPPMDAIFWESHIHGLAGSEMEEIFENPKRDELIPRARRRG